MRSSESKKATVWRTRSNFPTAPLRKEKKKGRTSLAGSGSVQPCLQRRKKRRVDAKTPSQAER